MDKRKISCEEIRKMRQVENKKIIPTPKKNTNLVKPDFSPIFEKQNQFGYKKFGSYKKPKYKEPESPMKSPNFKTTVKMKGVNLFGTTSEINNGEINFFKKLNFDDYNDDKNNQKNAKKKMKIMLIQEQPKMQDQKQKKRKKKKQNYIIKSNIIIKRR